jgi:hypothetical protein
LNQAYVAKVELVCFLAGVVVAAAAVIWNEFIQLYLNCVRSSRWMNMRFNSCS